MRLLFCPRIHLELIGLFSGTVHRGVPRGRLVKYVKMMAVEHIEHVPTREVYTLSNRHVIDIVKVIGWVIEAGQRAIGV